MIQRSSLASRICGTAALVLLTCCAARLHAAAPATTASRTDISAAACTPAEERGRTTEEQARRPAMQVRTTGEQRRTTEVQTRTAEAPLRTAPSDDRSKRARHLAPRGEMPGAFAPVVRRRRSERRFRRPGLHFCCSALLSRGPYLHCRSPGLLFRCPAPLFRRRASRRRYVRAGCGRCGGGRMEPRGAAGQQDERRRAADS